MMDKKVIDEFSQIVGPNNILIEDLDLFTYSYDASFLPLIPATKPDLVMKPHSTQEVARIMELANIYRIPVVARGLGSGRTGGSVPVNGGLVLCLDEMNKILEFDGENLTITVEPGVKTQDIYLYCAQRGLFYPPDPSSLKHSTIGGNIAENAGGPRAVKYGVTGNYVMGLEVVLADGSVLQTGGKMIKNVTGYDLTRLFVGSEGTLGVITQAILKLIPMPKRWRTVQVLFDSLEGACAAVSRAIKSGTIPVAAELMDQISLQAVAKFGNFSLDPNVKAGIIFEFDGDSETSLEEQTGGVQKICAEYGSIQFRIAMTQEEETELWSLRRGLSSAVAALAPNRIAEDISVPRNALPEIVKRLRAIAVKYDLQMAIYGHAGDGNLHPSLLVDLSLPGEKEKVDLAVGEIFRAALAVGGTLSGEHGIGITKKEYITDALGETGVATIRSIKKALDPSGILNPGKIF
ncbi:FAD-binding protein [Desulfosporosinus fructosivorans]|uniref:FAD-binding protein n=1 Tax=Desulfosporosinus fructosivorans TaxID=2018669 RepID=A0A4Z0R5H3_9FIRM|nr:FAD-linked oxidase C-terminal domain-containing protein [Desulfosporosinus fructosivorans]TGE37689.1 FAD-binding protein [Desulfosporosinus fructosivorans]